jgi:hypothetical protein
MFNKVKRKVFLLLLIIMYRYSGDWRESLKEAHVKRILYSIVIYRMLGMLWNTQSSESLTSYSKSDKKSSLKMRITLFANW